MCVCARVRVCRACHRAIVEVRRQLVAFDSHFLSCGSEMGLRSPGLQLAPLLAEPCHQPDHSSLSTSLEAITLSTHYISTRDWPG